MPLLGAIEVSAGKRFLGTPMAFAASHAPTPMGALQSALAGDSLWVAADADADDMPVGFLLAEPVAGWLHILELSVALAAQGRGHGAALLAAAAAVAAAPGLGCDRLSLTTDRDIAFNGPWYRRRGFVEIGPDAAPDWLAAIPRREAADGLDPARRAIMVLRL